MRHFRAWMCVLGFFAILSGCASKRPASGEPAGVASAWPANLRGHLLVIGGGLDDDNRPVYERFVTLARECAAKNGGGVPRVVIATAATGDQEPSAKGKTQSIRAYCPECQIDVIRRETSTEETLSLVNAAHAMFFTGGDQKRITTRYLKAADASGSPAPTKELSPLNPRMVDTPEATAMRALLQRGGVIAGTSAGDAMMSDPMFLTGRSTEALGIRVPRARGAGRAPDEDPESKPITDATPLGPQIGQGMGFVPWIITDSHFFERHRFGRLVAALENTGRRIGLGVGEDACTEIDLAKGELIGISVADSLIVDVAGVQREGLIHRNLRASVLAQGQRVSLGTLQHAPIPDASSTPVASEEEIPVVEPGQNRQLASWRFFRSAQTPAAATQVLKLEGYEQKAWPAGAEASHRPLWAVVEIRPSAPAK